jgi:hypothetical protein
LLKPQGVKNILDYFCHGVEKVDLGFRDLESLLLLFCNLPRGVKTEEVS